VHQIRHRRRLSPPDALGVEVQASLAVAGAVLKWFSLGFAAPVAVALGTGESPVPFVVGGLAAAAAGIALERFVSVGARRGVGLREGFLVIALIWLLVPAFGALPYVVGAAPALTRPLDAYFESVSGFTATGATVVPQVEQLDQSMLFWRQLTHWLGGMGIIVVAIAVLPRLRVGGRQLLQRELPGPTEMEPLGETVRETARRLWKLYLGLSGVGTLLLCLLSWTGLDPAMDVFDAFSYATSAVALGGFAPRQDSAAGLAPITQWVLCGLMVLAGVNFLRLYRALLSRQLRVLAGDDELRLYLVLLAVGSAVLALELFASETVHGLGGVRAAAFQSVSVMTTTGLATLDWSRLGALAVLTLLLLMFIGASAASPTGSIKVVRHLILFRLSRRELEHSVHPEAVIPVRVSGVVIDEPVLRSVVMFLVLYLLVFALGALGLMLDARRLGSELDAFEALGAAASCLGNVGPAFGAAGPFGSYAGFSDLSTGVVTALMLLGRVEIVPFALLLTRSYWRA
jgi:trk system potassium uptake protein